MSLIHSAILSRLEFHQLSYKLDHMTSPRDWIWNVMQPQCPMISQIASIKAPETLSYKLRADICAKYINYPAFYLLSVKSFRMKKVPSQLRYFSVSANVASLVLTIWHYAAIWVLTVKYLSEELYIVKIIFKMYTWCLAHDVNKTISHVC